MTLNPLFKLREWLTLDEAAQQLSAMMIPQTLPDKKSVEAKIYFF